MNFYVSVLNCSFSINRLKKNEINRLLLCRYIHVYAVSVSGQDESNCFINSSEFNTLW